MINILYKMKRIQRKRTKGWKMPKNTVYVGRPSKWGNPFILQGDSIFIDAGYRRKLLDKWVFFCFGNIDDVLRLYKFILISDKVCANMDLEYWRNKFSKYDILELANKDLACFCSLSEKCHADVLLEILLLKRKCKAPANDFCDIQETFPNCETCMHFKI
jgi:hypothetical protein